MSTAPLGAAVGFVIGSCSTSSRGIVASSAGAGTNGEPPYLGVQPMT